MGNLCIGYTCSSPVALSKILQIYNKKNLKKSTKFGTYVILWSPKTIKLGAIDIFTQTDVITFS